MLFIELKVHRTQIKFTKRSFDMKRIVCSILVLALALFSLCSCKMRYLPVYGKAMDIPYFVIQELPTKNAGGETTLEFWIGETVTESDYDGHAIVYDGFLGEGYTEDVLGVSIKTERYVHYTVRNYPKVDSKKMGIVQIEVTDPEVKIYGLTTESSLDDFAAVFEALGAKVDQSDKVVNAKLGDVWFQLSKVKGVTGDYLPKIRIDTDQMGIVYID